MLQEKQKGAESFDFKLSSKERFINLLDVLSLISIGLVAFGIFSIGFFVAPVVFKNLTPRPLAAEIMTDIFLRYYPFAFVCSLLALINESVRFFVSSKITQNKKLQILRLTCVLAICFMTSYSAKKILPEINQMRIESKSPTLWTNPYFVSLHKQSEMLGKASFVIGLIPIMIMVVSRKRL